MHTPSKTAFPKEFGTELAPYLYTAINNQKSENKQTNKQKKNTHTQNIYCFKMAANILILISRNGHVTKMWKTTFPKEFFNKIWLKIGEHEIYVTDFFLTKSCVSDI